MALWRAQGRRVAYSIVPRIAAAEHEDTGAATIDQASWSKWSRARRRSSGEPANHRRGWAHVVAGGAVEVPPGSLGVEQHHSPCLGWRNLVLKWFLLLQGQAYRALAVPVLIGGV